MDEAWFTLTRNVNSQSCRYQISMQFIKFFHMTLNLYPCCAVIAWIIIWSYGLQSKNKLLPLFKLNFYSILHALNRRTDVLLLHAMKFHRPVHSFSLDNSRRGLLYHCIWIHCGGELNLFHVQATVFSRCERLYSKKFCKYFKRVFCYISNSIFNSCETCLEAGSWHFDTLMNMVS
jgi:hypothetical protein